jgi:hypothetical protein
MTEEEVELRKQDYIDFYGLSTYKNESPKHPRCPCCGRYKKKNGHCSLEIPVNGGWSWEHY